MTLNMVDVAAELARLSAEVETLRHELGVQQDIQAIRRLHFTYGYLMDKAMFGQIVELFAEDADIYFMNGHFKGKAGARRMWGGSTGMSGPAYGLLFEHLMAQDVVTVAPDRRTARARIRCFELGGVHRTKSDPPPTIPRQFLEGGLYENEYVREDGVWKIKTFNYRIVWQCRFEDGWAETPPDPLMIPAFAQTFPENPRGPDALRDPPPRWPENQLVPFHYPHPVTGREMA